MTRTSVVAASSVGPDNGGGTATVVSSQPSGSGAFVTLRSGNGQGWTCHTAASGVVTGLTIA